MAISIPQDSDFIPLGLPTCPKKLIFHPLQTRMTHKGQARSTGSARPPSPVSLQGLPPSSADPGPLGPVQSLMVVSVLPQPAGLHPLSKAFRLPLTCVCRDTHPKAPSH